ncbi:unnamed protein product [Amoebophrya sp. A120]|nr:unnamed protein product [Amoebophrya sp. A120]|eukprot:GSA120T00023828001.1
MKIFTMAPPAEKGFSALFAKHDATLLLGGSRYGDCRKKDACSHLVHRAGAVLLSYLLSNVLVFLLFLQDHASAVQARPATSGGITFEQALSYFREDYKTIKSGRAVPRGRHLYTDNNDTHKDALAQGKLHPEDPKVLDIVDWWPVNRNNSAEISFLAANLIYLENSFGGVHLVERRRRKKGKRQASTTSSGGNAVTYDGPATSRSSGTSSTRPRPPEAPSDTVKMDGDGEQVEVDVGGSENGSDSPSSSSTSADDEAALVPPLSFQESSESSVADGVDKKDALVSNVLAFNDQGGDRMSRTCVLTTNPHASFSHSYAFGYAVHLLRLVKRLADKLALTTGSFTSSPLDAGGKKLLPTEQEELLRQNLQIGMAEVGILSGTGLALWHTLWNEILLPKLIEGGVAALINTQDHSSAIVPAEADTARAGARTTSASSHLDFGDFFQLFGFDLDPTVFARNRKNLVRRGAFGRRSIDTTELLMQQNSKTNNANGGTIDAPELQQKKSARPYQLQLPHVYKFVQGLSVWLNRQRVKNAVRYTNELLASASNHVGAQKNQEDTLDGTPTADDPIYLYRFDDKGTTTGGGEAPDEHPSPSGAAGGAAGSRSENEQQKLKLFNNIEDKNATFHVLIDDAYHTESSIQHTFDVFLPFLKKPWVFFVEDNCGAIYSLAGRLFDSDDVDPFGKKSGSGGVELFIHKTGKKNDCLIVVEGT